MPYLTNYNHWQWRCREPLWVLSIVRCRKSKRNLGSSRWRRWGISEWCRTWSRRRWLIRWRGRRRSWVGLSRMTTLLGCRRISRNLRLRRSKTTRISMTKRMKTTYKTIICHRQSSSAPTPNKTTCLSISPAQLIGLSLAAAVSAPWILTRLTSLNSDRGKAKCRSITSLVS